MKKEKENRCPICRTLLDNNENAICPQCGRIYIAKEGVSIRDRENNKWIGNGFTRKIFYVADNLFAYDKVDQSSGALQGGVRAGLAHAGPVGWVAGAVINTAIDVAQDKARESRLDKKVVSTAVCYNWGRVDSLTYPLEAFRVQLTQIRAGTSIGVKLLDGMRFTLIFGYTSEVVKEIYEKMNELHQKSLSRDRAARIRYQSQQDNSFSGNQFTQAFPQQNSAPVYANTSYTSAPAFFKCAYCGVTQMQEGNFCVYCGKPAPVPEPPKQGTMGIKNEVICPYCGNKQDTGGKFCFRCGQRLAAEPARNKICHHCGAEVKDGMLFCMECGTKV